MTLKNVNCKRDMVKFLMKNKRESGRRSKLNVWVEDWFLKVMIALTIVEAGTK